MDDSTDRNRTRLTALVTGGSRGVGAATVRELAHNGYDVAFTYRNKVKRADEVVQEVQADNGRALAVACDIVDEQAVHALAQRFGQWAGQLDLLVLNASGGLEQDLLEQDPQYPLHINRDAQLRLVDTMLPFLHKGAKIIFVTSHWAHLYGHIQQLPDYAPVAASKQAGEQALRARQQEFAKRGITLIVVTADLIEGTITARLMERTAPGLTEQRQHTAGTLPTIEDTAHAIVQAAIDPDLANGHTVVVGGSLESLRENAAEPSHPSR